MTDDHDTTELALEALLEEAGATPPAMPDGLVARVIADAEALHRPTVSNGWRSWLAGLGGLPGVGGLITASCVGFWLGVAPPTGLPDLAGQVLGIETVSDAEWDGADMTGFGWDSEDG